MSLSVEANTWAPKLIIAIQLTIWSLVGMMLLHKGAASLSRKPEVRNDTGQLQGRFRGVWNEKESNITESQPQIANRQKDVVNVDDLDNVLLYREQLQRSNGIVRESVIRKRTTIVREEGTDGARGQIVRASSTEKQAVIGHGEDRIKNANRMKSAVNENVFTLLEYDERSHSVDLVASDEDNSFERENKSSIGSDVKEMENHKDDTVSQRSSVNRIGAAAAILMLAIGVIMLLLGPLIVILRAISKRRRTREMLVKPMCRNDQPPSYEEATLMDRVPRYSTLQLDTILEPSSP